MMWGRYARHLRKRKAALQAAGGRQMSAGHLHLKGFDPPEYDQKSTTSVGGAQTVKKVKKIRLCTGNKNLVIPSEVEGSSHF